MRPIVAQRSTNQRCARAARRRASRSHNDITYAAEAEEDGFRARDEMQPYTTQNTTTIIIFLRGNTINSSLQVVVCPPRAAARLYGLVASNRAGCLASWQGRRYILCLYCTQRRRACLSIRWQKIAFEKRKSFYCCWHPRMAAYLSSSAVASKLSLMRSRVQRRAQLKENKE